MSSNCSGHLALYLNMIMNLDTFSLSPSPSRDIHPQIIPGTCMMKLPCVVTVQWVRRPPIASPKVHLWNPHSRRAAIATTILWIFIANGWYDMTYMREKTTSNDGARWKCEHAFFFIMRHPVMKPCQKLLLHNCTQSHTLEKPTLTKSRERRGTPSHVFHMC